MVVLKPEPVILVVLLQNHSVSRLIQTTKANQWIVKPLRNSTKPEPVKQPAEPAEKRFLNKNEGMELFCWTIMSVFSEQEPGEKHWCETNIDD